MQAVYRVLLGIGDTFDRQLPIGQMPLDVRLEAVLLEDAEVVFELLFFLFVLQNVIPKAHDTIADQSGRVVAE